MSDPSPNGALPWWARGALVASVILGLPGCLSVTVYEPLLGLQRPVVLRTDAANFEGQRILVRCVPNDYMDSSEMDGLCGLVRTAFSNQGAEVEVEVPRDGAVREDSEERPSPKDLTIELSSRLLHEDNPPILWFLSYITLTLVPVITEFSFAQDVRITDGDGGLLVSDSLQGRFIKYIGAGVWAVNGLLDLAVRKEDEKINENTLKDDFSRDFYGQLSQLAFHARKRSQVLRGFSPAGAPSPPPAAPPPEPTRR